MSGTVEGGLRVVLAEDSVILREGMVELLSNRGCEVIAAVGTAEEMLDAVAANQPDVVVLDIRMPPTWTDEGIRAARRLRERWPQVGVLVFSQHLETTWARRLLDGDAAGMGYLLKERVARTAELVDALRRVADGGTVLDPEIVMLLLHGGRRRRMVESLTPREREVLDLMAEGHSNMSIAQRLVVTDRAVEKHVAAIFTKFDLPHTENDNRRVKAVIAYLTDTRPEGDRPDPA